MGSWIALDDPAKALNLAVVAKTRFVLYNWDAFGWAWLLKASIGESRYFTLHCALLLRALCDDWHSTNTINKL